MRGWLSFVLMFFAIKGYCITECNVQFFSTILYFEKGQDSSPENFFQATNCSNEVQQKIVRVVNNYDSTIKARYLEKILLEEIQDYKIKITPTVFKLIEFKNYLNDSLMLPRDNKIIKANLLNNSLFLKLTEDEKIRFQCDDCNYLGHKNIKLVIENKKTGKSLVEWINATIAAKTKVLIATKNIGASPRGFDGGDFREDYVYATNPEIYFGSKEEIQFYRPTQSLVEGNVLKYTDMISLDIVKLGHPTSIIFQKDGISLSGTAIPVKNAKYNEIIKLQRNNKTYVSGRVVNFNQVKVDL